MKKKLIFGLCVFTGLAIALSAADPVFPRENESNENIHYTCFVREELTEEAEQLNEFMAKYFRTFKNHDSKVLKELYADEFISGDGFTKNELISLLNDSWELSTDLSYESQIQDIKFDSSYATVEINENLTGTTLEKSEITGDNGLIESTVRTVLYLRKFGKGWRVISDKTLYEETSIKYGDAKGLDISLYAPGQVFPEHTYTISLEADIPDDMFAVASIIRETLSYPREKSEEVFRQVPVDIKLLERVVESNNKFRNELAVASVSYCNVKKDTYKRPEIELSGTAVLIKRVNVVNVVAPEDKNAQ